MRFKLSKQENVIIVFISCIISMFITNFPSPLDDVMLFFGTTILFLVLSIVFFIVLSWLYFKLTYAKINKKYKRL